MSCGCKSSESVQSYYDLAVMTPLDPLDLIAYAILGTDIGVPTNSSTYIAPTGGSAWIASPIQITSGSGIFTNAGDNAMMAQDATNWNFSHKIVNVATTVAPPMRKVVFMRAGLQWTNFITLGLPVSPTFSELQLSFLENGGTRGDAQGTVPVIRWSAGGPFGGPKQLSLILKQPGRFTLGLLGINSNSIPDWSMFELDIIAV